MSPTLRETIGSMPAQEVHSMFPSDMEVISIKMRHQVEITVETGKKIYYAAGEDVLDAFTNVLEKVA